MEQAHMDEQQQGFDTESPVSLEINVNHRYKAEEMGVIEFRIRNEGPRLIKNLDLVVDCPCEKSTRKSAVLKNITPLAEKKPSFQFEPARGGEALLEIELRVEDETRLPLVFRGQTSVTISSKNEGSTSHTSFNIEFRDVQKFMGNDLSGILAGAGKGEINAERLHERMERKEPFWMRVDLDFDEHETVSRRSALRQIIAPPAAQMPPRTVRACLESLDPAAPRRAFFYSMPEVVFGREPQKSDAVLRFLPDFFNDPRSRTISGAQFVVRYREGECTLSMAPQGHQLMSVNHKLLAEQEQVQLSGAADIKIGPCELALKITCAPRTEDPQWMRTRAEIRRFDPGDDPFATSRWDLIGFTRPTNGQEEEYLWLFHKMDIGWDVGGTSALQLGWPVIPRARLAYWNSRYYLEAAGSETEVKLGTSPLPPGKIACLEARTEISFGPLRFLWKLP
jgi:hypothetical protein